MVQLPCIKCLLLGECNYQWYNDEIHIIDKGKVLWSNPNIESQQREKGVELYA
jgi:hypothetical protein